MPEKAVRITQAENKEVGGTQGGEFPPRT